MKKLALTLYALLLTASSAFAADYKVGDLMIKNPLARSTPVNAPVSGGYMTITNMGPESDRLVAASVDFAGETQIHEMKMDGDVMKMRQLENGLEIPAGETVMLMPGGYHVMFMKLGEQLQPGEMRKATLTFEKAGTVEVEFNVETLENIKAGLGADEMKMKME